MNKTLPEKYQPLAIILAFENNYHLKRSEDSKNAVCELVNAELMKEFSCFKGADNVVFRTLFDAEKEKRVEEKRKARKKADDRPLEAGNLENSSENWDTLSGRCFIITSAQNNTPPHHKFLKALEKYAEYRNAQLLISQYTYNKNGFQTLIDGEKNKLYYHESLRPYFVYDAVYLNSPKLAFLANINILPTADYPLTGMEEQGQEGDIIIGHSKISAQAIAALKGDTVKRMYSSGTVTQRNYIQQKAGQKAERLHCYGALIVEFNDRGDHFIRQVQTFSESGEFYDLDYKITSNGVEVVENTVAAVQWGDIHAEKIDLVVANASWGSSESILHTLKPKYQLVHDVLDFTARNHHNISSGFFLAEQYYSGKDSVKEDLKACYNVLNEMYADTDYGQIVIVESNHDLALTRWLDSVHYNPSSDPVNAFDYYKLKARMYQALAEQDSSFNMLKYSLTEFLGEEYTLNDAIFLKTDDSFKVAGVEMGIHGHTGANGSRGTPKQFKKLGIPINSGHTHTPSIFGNVYTAGVSGKLDMGYNEGASSWCHTHIVTYANGARTLIDVKDGEWFGCQF